MTRYVIVGNGIAGVMAAQAIARAEEGADVQLYAAEAYPYYRRPQLPAYIAGEVTEAEITYRPPEWYAEQGIQVHLDSPVEGIEPSAHRIRRADNGTVPYDRLLLATGGRAWMVPVEGVVQEGFFTLRTLEDAHAICDRADDVQRAVVIGGGLLGLETARALRARGLEVTVLELSSYLMPRQVDPEGGVVLQGVVEALGIRVLTSAATEAILGDGAVTGVRVKDGPDLAAGMVVCAAGWRPNVTLARDAGLTVNRGVVVDPYLRTSAADIYAAGDVAEAGDVLYGIVPAAIEQARAAAANMVNPGSVTYTGTLPFTTLKVVGAELSSLGEALVDEESTVQLRHVDLAERHYRKFVLREGRLVGAILLNERKRSLIVRQLIQEQVDVSGYAHRLLDDHFDLKSLLDAN